MFHNKVEFYMDDLVVKINKHDDHLQKLWDLLKDYEDTSWRWIR